MNLFKKIYYKWRINYKISCFDFKPFVKILEDYHKFTEPIPEGDEDFAKDFYITDIPGRVECFRNTENTEFDIYYENMHMHITDTKKDKVVTISLKKNNDRWSLASVNGVIDVSNPINDTMEVFCWYDVFVMNRKRCEGVEYVEGVWNKYFYCTLVELEKTIVGFTLAAQFTEEYNAKKENKRK